MCGICGMVGSPAGAPVDANALVRMRDVLTHRGPDEAGLLLRPSVGLGHRRLSIIDLSPAGRQPMSNEDGSIWLIYNGETYNFKELRRNLERRGHRFRSDTDSEVLVHLYEEDGCALVDRLRGMFAFAIWDERRQRLVLGRDRFGVKPLYYAHTPGGGLVFGSEIKAVLASGLVEAALDPAALSEYLATRYTTGARTLYRGVVRLPPGHTATWQDGRLELRRYWSPPAAEQRHPERSEAELVAEFDRRFEESVVLRMVSDAPIGVFLSGGIDSSAIAAKMAAHSEAPIRTFSVAFRDRRANELAYAREVAHALGATHREVIVSPTEYFDALPRLVWHEDEPIAFPSSVPLYFVSRLAAEDVKVVLTGEGSDELLAGYGKYWRALYNLRAARAYERLPAGVRSAARRLVMALPAGTLGDRLRRSFLARPGTVESLYLENFGVFDGAMQRRLLTPELQGALADQGGLDPFAGHRLALGAQNGSDLLQRQLGLDWQTYLHELLMKQDQMSMAASIESRVPFLDHELAEFAAGLPRGLKLRGFTTKRVLRLAMRKQLPRRILTRAKMGFPTPVGTWLRRDFGWLLDEIVLSPQARERGLFDFRYVSELVAAHRTGRRDHTEQLWALLNVELWFRECLTGARIPSHAA